MFFYVVCFTHNSTTFAQSLRRLCLRRVDDSKRSRHRLQTLFRRACHVLSECFCRRHWSSCCLLWNRCMFVCVIDVSVSADVFFDVVGCYVRRCHIQKSDLL